MPLLCDSINPDIHKAAKHIVNPRDRLVKVSITAIGEAFMEVGVNTSNCDEAAKSWAIFIAQGKLCVAGYGNNVETISLACELMDIDHYLKPADSIILSTALLDESCRHLYTTDRVLLESIRLQEKAEGYETEIKEPPGLKVYRTAL